MKQLVLAIILIVSIFVAGCAGPQIKWNDARKIKSGMTTEEVTRILGEPNGVFSREGKLIYSWYSVSLANGSRGIRIEFKDNKVTDAPAVPDSFKD
jgi:hypothetical protein